MRKVRNARLILETLEDRVTPTYVWTGASGVDTGFQTPANWRVLETGAVATQAPDPGTDCMVYETSPVNISIDGQGVACRSLSIAAKWQGIVDFIHGGVLNIWGINGANSNIWNGRFDVQNAGDKGAVDVHGGDTYYDDQSLNWDTATNGTLDVYSDRGGNFIIGPDCTNIGANLHAGMDVTGALWSGKVEFQTNSAVKNYGARPGTAIDVSSQGYLKFDTNAVISGETVTDAGVLELSDGSGLGLSPLQSLTVTNGGWLKAPNSGQALINGSVSMTNATLQMGTSLGSYSTLYINGDLAMSGGIFSYDVSASTSGQSDVVDVGGSITFVNNVASYCYTSGLIYPGVSQTPLISDSSQANVKFGVTAWLGTGYHWNLTYTVDGFFLSSGMVGIPPSPVPGPVPGPAPGPAPAALPA